MNILKFCTLIFLSFSVLAETAPSQIRCITYTIIAEAGGNEETYNEPKFFDFYEAGEVASQSHQLTETSSAHVFMKMLDKTTAVVVDEKDKLSNPHPAYLMDLGKYSYIGHAALNLLEDDTEVRLTALCYLTADEARVPFIKNFKAMISKGIKSLSEAKFNQLSK